MIVNMQLGALAVVICHTHVGDVFTMVCQTLDNEYVIVVVMEYDKMCEWDIFMPRMGLRTIFSLGILLDATLFMSCRFI